MNSIKISYFLFSLAATLLLTSCKESKTADSDSAKLSIDFEKYELANGLDVVLHQDKSDPIVSLAIQYGVGSNREKLVVPVLRTSLSTCYFRNRKMCLRTSFSKNSGCWRNLKWRYLERWNYLL